MFEWSLDLGKTDAFQHDPPRAQRYDLQLPVSYRAHGGSDWREGRTANISYTGVRFWTDQLLEAHTQVEIRLKLPAVGGVTGTEIMCRGEIVRAELPASRDAQPSLAAKFLECKFVHGQRTAA